MVGAGVGVDAGIDVGAAVGVGAVVEVGGGVDVGSGVAVALLPHPIRNNATAAKISMIGGFRPGLLANSINPLTEYLVDYIVEIGWINFFTVAGPFRPN